MEIAIYDGLVASQPIVGELGDTGGPTAALEDEVVEAVHRPHCGCYWCNRWAFLQVHFARPDATPDTPAKIQPKSVAAKIQPTSVAAKIRIRYLKRCTLQSKAFFYFLELLPTGVFRTVMCG